MGSITEEDYNNTERVFNRYYHNIILLNRDNILYAVQEYQKSGHALIDLQMPEKIPYSPTYILYLSQNQCHIAFLHYILKSWKSFEDFHNEFKRHFHGQILRAVRPIQRRWRDSYYNPDTGLWIQKHAPDVAKRNGMKP